MNLEKFQAATEGQKTIRLTHKMARGDGYVTVNREVEMSDLSVGESGLIQYTCYMAGVCRHVLTRVSEVVEVESVCTIEEWNAGCDAFDALHDLVGLAGM
tara:strand:- start:646 stop:945 length:300 start_codon:yes stop_codon:yes gene_type:complete